MKQAISWRRASTALLLGASLGVPTANAALLDVDGDLSDLIGVQGQPISGSTSDGAAAGDGFDIKTAYFHYDTGSDTFYFGMDFWGTVGNSGIFPLDTDPNAFDFLENYWFQLDLNNDGIDMDYSLVGDGIANSGPNSETVNLDSTPGSATVAHAVSESFNGVEFSISGLGFEGPFTVYLRSGATSGSEQVEVSGVVPIPAAVWLFGSGLLALAGFSQRKLIK